MILLLLSSSQLSNKVHLCWTREWETCCSVVLDQNQIHLFFLFAQLTLTSGKVSCTFSTIEEHVYCACVCLLQLKIISLLGIINQLIKSFTNMVSRCVLLQCIMLKWRFPVLYISVLTQLFSLCDLSTNVQIMYK